MYVCIVLFTNFIAATACVIMLLAMQDVLDTVSSVTKKLPSVNKLSGKRSNSKNNGSPFAPGDSTDPDMEFQDARETLSRGSAQSLPDVEEGRPLQRQGLTCSESVANIVLAACTMVIVLCNSVSSGGRRIRVC